MILSKNFYYQCDSSYKKVIDELEKQISEIQKQNIFKIERYLKIHTIIAKFSNNYLISKQYWKYCMQLFVCDQAELSFVEWNMLCSKIAKQAYFHLYYNKEWNYLDFPGNNESIVDENLDAYGNKVLMLIDYQKSDALILCNHIANEQDFNYPHSHLKECFCQFEKSASYLPPKALENKYEKMKELYFQIKSAENDVEEWFKLLLKVGNDIFLKHNVEYRLGQNLLDAKLWKLYIRYLKHSGDYKWLLETYSKYCRFFLDDHKMMEEYKQATAEYGPVWLWWENLFEFEVGYEEDSNNEVESVENKNCGNKNTDIVVPFDRNICANFYDTYQFQNFSLRVPLITYILKNANHRISRKLFNSCKYFFAKKPTPICYKLIIDPRKSFYSNEKLILKHSSNYKLFLKNTYITGEIDVVHQSNGNNVMSSLIPHLSCCEAKYVSLDLQNLTFNELKFLIKEKTVVELEISRCHVKDENNKFIDLVKIMEYLPNIEKLQLPEVRINANTAHALKMQSFVGKIYDFYIDSIYGEPFDSNDLLEYCIANRDERFSLCWYFNKEFSDAFFIQKLNKVLKDYQKSSRKITKMTSIFVL